MLQTISIFLFGLGLGSPYNGRFKPLHILLVALACWIISLYMEEG